MLFGILCLVLLPFGFASINTTCLPSNEVDALMEIGRKLGKSWNFNEDPCTSGEWAITATNNSIVNNVTCAPRGINCSIVSISLKGQSLVGILPPELVKLRYLENIDLARNLLSGPIPPEWGSMEHILNISVLGNLINGSIPKELGNLTKLTTLIVEDNLMSGRIPEEFGNISSIERLFLDGNYFTGELPPSFANLINLTDFRISSNNFSGKIPDFIGGWTRLRLLMLRSCNLIGELPENISSLVPGDPNLFDFSFNKLNGSIPEGFRDLLNADFIYLTGNLLSGSVPSWILESSNNIDLSYNNFTFERSRVVTCQMQNTNLFASFSKDNMSTSEQVSCLPNVCQNNITSLYINCGGERQSLEDGKKTYEADLAPGSASGFVSVENRWGFSNTGDFDDRISDSYIKRNRSRVLGSNPELYSNARASALSLTYYGFCMHKGSYNVSLHFAEIVFTDDGTYSSLGRRVFDIYIQGKLVEKDFDISQKAGGIGKTYVSSYPVNVTSTLEIRLYYAGKGTTTIPLRGNYGPLISAISVDPNFWVPQEDGSGNGDGVSSGLLAGIVVATVCVIILILGVLWWLCCSKMTDTMDLELSGVTGSFTLRQIKAATNNFDAANKIGEGGFGSVYKGALPNGTLIAVKQLSSKSRQGNREFLNELGVISALQHPHLVKLHGCCIEGNQLLLAYEYMENNSLSNALFGPKEMQLELDWPTRYRICIDIARGLSFLHEESRLKIVHRDIKASNVLLDKDLNAKVSDFGLAKLDEEDNTHIITRVAGTYGYMAPEYAQRGYLTDKADVYSYGIVLLEIVSGMANTADRAKQNHFILLDRAVALKNEGSLMELVDPRLGSDYNIHEVMVVASLALVCTTISPTDRPAMSAVVSMLEGRIVPKEVAVVESISESKVYREKMMKQLLSTDESIPYTDSTTSASTISASTTSASTISASTISAPDLYPVTGVSEYLLKRDNGANESS
ncbi:hypothetical protein OSB04_005859 [Centaurea solstitialis]|uniref:non-specific serine/threonine protein kinase n=1 Tax=Centaurea solstitialis TaxID=347529 RepID=A0AA38TGU8_9ASTR|nr:hypothetical protein OSB04_005859 [Centaurea solstitialis]